MGPRRAHKKSRNGCRWCKARKVKCDETRPHCNNCVKHGVDCVYGSELPESAGSSQRIQSASPNPATFSSTLNITSPVSLPISPVGPGESSSHSLGMAEMALLHHFSTSTCYTISRNPILQTVWQIRIPQASFSSPFVFRGILALSALHLAHLKPEFHDHYTEQAEMHHNTALQMVSSILPNVTQENSQSIYIFSILTCLISCAKPRLRDDFWSNNDRDIEWLTLFRGTTSIIASAGESLKTGPLAPMFAMGHRRKLARDARSATGTPHFLVTLKQILEDSVLDPSELHCYHESIDDMAKSFATVAELGSHNCETADIFIWMLRVSDEYFEYFRRRTPESLVIFAYFCVVMKEMEWAWWMQGFSVHTISGIYYSLDEEHRCWLQWPMQQVGWVP